MDPDWVTATYISEAKRDPPFARRHVRKGSSARSGAQSQDVPFSDATLGVLISR